jgi:hypothetical protein
MVGQPEVMARIGSAGLLRACRDLLITRGKTSVAVSGAEIYFERLFRIGHPNVLGLNLKLLNFIEQIAGAHHILRS